MSVDPQIQAACQGFQRGYQAVRGQIAKAIVGQDAVVDGVLTCLFAGGHVLLEGVPGLGKTLLVRTLAAALDLKFSRIQFTPDLMPSDISGTSILTENESGRRAFSFMAGPVFAQILLADEINRATPKTQSALLEAMQERQVTAGGQVRPLPLPFFVLATQNPLEHEGTYPLPEAQLDRFFFKLVTPYGSREELNEIVDRTTGGGAPNIEPVLDGARIVAHQELVRRVVIAPHVRDYAVRCVLATHGHEHVRVGASPRAAQAMVLAGKVAALLDGRFHVSLEDVRSAAIPAMRHRLILNFEALAADLSADSVLEGILARVEKPRD
jgi:MoxR-like ATPase